MKSILVADNRSDLLATLEPILKHWGYRVLSARKTDQITPFLQESAPSLLIIGEDLLSDSALTLDPATSKRVKSGDLCHHHSRSSCGAGQAQSQASPKV